MSTATMQTKVDNLETLLKIRSARGNNIMNPSDEADRTDSKTGPEPTKARKSATLEDMMEMLSLIVSKCMRKEGVIFQPDEGARLSIDQGTPVDNPYICYQVISRVPTKELKPRPREELHENTSDENSRRAGRIYGQRFECLVQFNIVAPDYKTANKTMSDFENLMFNYTSYLKQEGVAEVIFNRQFTDTNLDMYRQSASIRSLQYLVIIEKLYTMFSSEIAEIIIE